MKRLCFLLPDAETAHRAGVNALLAATAGAAFPNSRLAQFEDAIKAGSMLVMVNVADEAIVKIEKLVKLRHPNAEIEGFEPDPRPTRFLKSSATSVFLFTVAGISCTRGVS
jgi:hypothetical protein